MARKLECWKEPIEEIVREFEEQGTSFVTIRHQHGRLAGNQDARRLKVDQRLSRRFPGGFVSIRYKT